ncbi:hypothetical protein CLOP_g16577 [Closterium sp. NIES-67]|nr:hypothetical protein CLOP_g16577 [Closterium sp. NIES-67]
MAWHGAAWHGVAWNGTTSHCMASDAHWGSQGGGARRALVIPGSDRGGKASKKNQSAEQSGLLHNFTLIWRKLGDGQNDIRGGQGWDKVGGEWREGGFPQES